MVVSNARNVKVTGNKAEQLVYRYHTMYPGGLKEIKYRDMMSKKPDEVCPNLISLVWLLYERKRLARCIDYTSGRFRNVAEKQAQRPKTGTAADIP